MTAAATSTNLDFALQVSPGKQAELVAELDRIGRVRLIPALEAPTAEALRQELLGAQGWVRNLRKGAATRQIDAETLARLSPAQLAAVEALARNNDGESFRFVRDALSVPLDPEARRARGWLVDRMIDALNSPASLAMASVLAGTPVRAFRGDATRYLPGHFLTLHNDRSDAGEDGQRALALVINLSPWNIDWGGLLLFHDADGNAECGWTPQFNTANLFRVPMDHSVSWVTPLAAEPRLTVSGWFYAD